MEPTQPAPQQPAPQPMTPSPAPQQPAPAAPPQPTMQPTAMAGGKGNKKKMLLIVLAAAVLAVAGIGYAVYAYMTNTPDYLLKQAVEQFAKENAVAGKFTLTSGSGGASVSFSGDLAARTDSENTKNGELVVGLGSGSSRVGLTARTLDGDLYVRGTSLDNLPALVKSFSAEAGASYDTPEFIAALSRINEQWFTLTKNELKELAATAGQEVESNVTVDDLKKLKAIYDKNSFLKADKVSADEVVDGVNSAKFTLKVDPATYKAFLTELKAANIEAFPVSDADIAKADKTPETSEDVTITVWVARDSKKFRQIEMVTKDANIKLTLETSLPTLEKLEKPSDAKPFSEFWVLFLGYDPYDPSLYLDM